MDLNPLSLETAQPALFEYGEAATGTLELFPAVWSAAEELVSPESSTRHKGLDRLLEMGAARLSPLVAYLFATRLSDTDLHLRVRVVYALGSLMVPDVKGYVAPEPVRRYLAQALSQMRTRQIFALLEVAVEDPGAANVVARLLNACPYAGSHLAEILVERKNPVPIRRTAARLIGLVGYLDAIPALERLLSRIEARRAGQQSMPFAPPTASDEADLYPAIKEALARLNAP
ncbi:MAG: hypothetical protein JW726_01565 [Anaerolineales bacterium]|nr:hypothetical protein [Anaerolineales bacterium]